jgi:hypothetical protein
MSDNKATHLRLIVELLDQLNKASLYSKRWCISISAVFLALSSQVKGMEVAFLAVFPLLFLWILDAQNERREALLYRLYERVRKTPEPEIDFDINTKSVATPQDTVVRYLFHPDQFFFYAAMIAGIFLVDYFLT